MKEKGRKEVLNPRASEVSKQIRKAEALQAAIYKIAAIAISDISLQELFFTIHQIISDLMDANNFFIALHDPEREMLELPYFVDTKDTSYDGPYPASDGLTEFVIRHGAPLLVRDIEHQAMIDQGLVSLVGPRTAVWLGVPLKSSNQTIGAMVVQHYTDTEAYQETEKQVLTFISGQVAAAIERKQTEDALRESEARYRTLVENAPEAIVILDAETMKFVDANENAEKLYGLSREALLETGPISLSPAYQPDGRPSNESALEKITQAMNGEKQVFEWLHQTLEGTEVYCRVQLVPVPSLKGRYMRGSVTDITESKKTEEALRQAQKLESLGILAGGVAHDFNNLLVAMLGQTSLALEKLPRENAARPHLEKAVLAAERATDLTRQMLAYSGRGHFKVRPLDLNELIEQNLHLFAASIPKTVNLHAQLTNPLPTIKADAGQMQQVIMNLILNSAEAIGDTRGEISIRTETRYYAADDGQFWLHTGLPLAPGTYVVLEVQDDGIGMEITTQARIFDPFFSTKFTGRGLGLAVVLGIIRGHKGGLRVQSQIDEGTTFTCLFPVASIPAADPIPVPARISENGHSPSMVLVIDDEEPVRVAVSDILDLEGIDVAAAANGAEGIALFQEKSADFNLVLLDLSMPDMSGDVTFQRLQEIDASVPVLLSSGYSQSEISRRFSELGFAGFLQKPYSMEGLITVVKRHLGHGAAS